MICRICGKRIIKSRQLYRHIGPFVYSRTKGYVYKAYEHIDCNTPLPPKPKSFKDLCQKLNLAIDKKRKEQKEQN